MRFSIWLERLPWSVVALASALMGVGWLAISRANALDGVGRGVLGRQVVWSALALALMFAASVPNYRRLARWSFPLLTMAVGLLAVVYLFPPVNGARRWIRVGPLGFQPSELAKLAFVVALARYLSYRESCRRLTGLVAPVALTLVPVVLVLKEPDLGSALVFLPVLGVMLLAAGARASHLASAAVVALAVAPLLWHEMSREQRSRITALIAQAEAPRQPSDDDYHLYQAKQLMALGGWTGSWINPTPVADVRARLVPESHTDSVVAVLGERTGLVGLAVVLLLFLALIGRLLRIAAASREPFGRLLAVGVATLLGVQATINTGMMVGLLPITGLTLPLVSYGGSSLLVTGAALGLAMSVAVHADYEVGPEPFVYE